MTFVLSGEVRISGKTAKAEIEGLEKSQDKLKKSTKGLSTEGKKAAISSQKLGAGARKASADVDRLSSAERMAAQEARTLGRANQVAAGQVGNLTAQFNDIGVMMMAGQNPLQMAIQQGTQISQVIGPMGAAGAVKSLKSALVAMVSPISLITLGSIAAGAAMIQWLTDSGDEAETLDDILGDLTDRVDSYVAAVRLAHGDDGDLAAAFGAASDAGRALMRNMAKIERDAALDRMRAAAVDLSEKLGDLSDQKIDPFGHASLSIYEGTIEDLGEKFELTQHQAETLGLGLKGLYETATPEQAVEAASRFSAVLLEVFGNANSIPGPLKEVAQAAGDLAESAGKMLAVDEVDTTAFAERLAATLKYSDQQHASAEKLLTTLEAENTLRWMQINYGKDSAEVAGLRRVAERQVFDELLASFDVSEDLKEELHAAFENGQLLAGMDIASGIGSAADEAARLAGNLAIAQGKRVDALVGGNVDFFDPRNEAGLSGVISQTVRNPQNTRRTNTGRRGGGGAGQETQALARLFEQQQLQLDVLRETDPILREMLRHRKALSGATNEERAMLEQLISTRVREEEAITRSLEKQELFSDVTEDALRGLGSNEVILPAGGTTFEFEALPLAEFDIRVRSVSAIGTKSAWTPWGNIVAAADTTPPDAPTGLKAVTGFEAYWLEWDANTETDLSHYLVRQRTGADNSTNEKFHTVAGTSLAITGVAASEVSWFRIYAVDTSLNQSEISAATSPASVTVPSGVTNTDIAGIVDLAAFAAGITPIEVLGSLPDAGNFEGRQLFLTTDKKLYRHDGTDLSGTTGWTSSVDGVDIIANSIVAGMLQAGAIGARELAAFAVLAKHMAIGDFTNLIPDPYFRDDDAWSSDSGTLSFVTTTNAGKWGSDKYINLISSGTEWASADSLPFAVTPGSEVWVHAALKEQTGAGTVGVRLQYSDTADFSGAIDNDWMSYEVENATSTTKKKSSSSTVPSDKPWARIRIYNTNDGALDGRFGKLQVRYKNAGELIVDGSIIAQHLDIANAVITATAQIKNAIITNAKIADLSAAKLTAGTALAGSLTVSGTALSTVEDRASDPADRINAKSTKIDPGKVVISGGTTLADWRDGGDQTKIDGGALSANSVAANSMQIGQRGISMKNIVFSTSGNTVSWTSGKIYYIDDSGAEANVSIVAGSANWTSGTRFIFWVKDATGFSGTTDSATARGANKLIVAIYTGGSDISTDIGMTIIDGDRIKTGVVDTGHLAADAVTATKISVTDLSAISANLGSIEVTNANIKNLTVGTNEITGNAVTKIRKSSANSPSVTWTPSVDGEFVAMLSGEVSVSAAGAATTNLYIRKNGSNKGVPISVSKGDTSPDTQTENGQGSTSWKGATVDGTSITLDTNGNGTNCDLIVIETKK